MYNIIYLLFNSKNFKPTINSPIFFVYQLENQFKTEYLHVLENMAHKAIYIFLKSMMS